MIFVYIQVHKHFQRYKQCTNSKQNICKLEYAIGSMYIVIQNLAILLVMEKSSAT